MADIIASYNQRRITNRSNPSGVLHQFLMQGEHWSNDDLEHLAIHLSNCVVNGIYPSREAIYPLIDLESMVYLKRYKSITEKTEPGKPKPSLQAVYALLEDYLLPEQQQRYRFRPQQAAMIMGAAINLGF